MLHSTTAFTAPLAPRLRVEEADEYLWPYGQSKPPRPRSLGATRLAAALTSPPPMYKARNRRSPSAKRASWPKLQNVNILARTWKPSLCEKKWVTIVWKRPSRLIPRSERVKLFSMNCCSCQSDTLFHAKYTAPLTPTIAYSKRWLSWFGGRLHEGLRRFEESHLVLDSMVLKPRTTRLIVQTRVQTLALCLAFTDGFLSIGTCQCNRPQESTHRPHSELER